MAKSSKSVAGCKPKKPHPDFPLFPHATRRWAKKVRGKLVYFGPWRDPEGALRKWLDQKDDLLAGRTPRVKGDGLNLADLVNRFLTSKRQTLESGELSERSFKDYYKVCQRLVAFFGRNRLATDLAADDFEALRANFAKTHGPHLLGKDVQVVRMIFRYGYEAGLLTTPMRFGPTFRRPSRKTMRLQRTKTGILMFEPHEIRLLLDAAGVPLRAMILLGINAALGQADLGAMPTDAVDLKRRWLTYSRIKTGVERSASLWPETCEAIRETMKRRPEPKSEVDRGILFITRRGRRWVGLSATDKGAWKDSIALEFGKLLRELDLKRPRLQFYSLRRTFATVASQTFDQPAINLVMGHSDNSMPELYRQKIDRKRLQRVSQVVHDWLFAGQGIDDGIM